MKVIDPFGAARALASFARKRPATWCAACAVAAAALLAAAGPARAHGDAAHTPKPAAALKEQKPWGIAGSAKAARRSIDVAMSDDMRFTPERIDVKHGETVRFLIRNAGAVMHEFVIGTQAELDAHAALMQKFPDMEHDEPYMAHVAPGKTGQIVWTFNRAGEFDFACLIAGHYQAGMKGKIFVASAKAAAAPRSSAAAQSTQGASR